MKFIDRLAEHNYRKFSGNMVLEVLHVVAFLAILAAICFIAFKLG